MHARHRHRTKNAKASIFPGAFISPALHCLNFRLGVSKKNYAPLGLNWPRISTSFFFAMRDFIWARVSEWSVERPIFFSTTLQ
jgi:hypothetical protein